MRVALLTLVLAAACATHSAGAPSPVRLAAPPPRPTAAPAASVPQPPAACRGAAACVQISAHRAWLRRDGRLTGPFPIATGGPGHATPRGTFAVAWKDEVHTSTTYGIPMPYSVFFAPDGVAFHEGDVHEASHGCVHLRHADAALFFATLQRGDEVRVV